MNLQVSDVASTWWSLLTGRIRQAAHALPEESSGYVEIRVERTDGPIFFHLDVNGPGTSGAPGRAPAPAQTFVKTSESALERVLFGDEIPAGAIEVSGDAALFLDLLRATARAPAARSWVGARGGA